MAMFNSYVSLPEQFHQENIGRLIFSQFSILVAYGVHRYELIYSDNNNDGQWWNTMIINPLIGD